MTVHVPGDHPDLAAALAAGADDIVLHGVVSGGLLLDRPVRLRGEPGATLRGGGPRVLIVEADAEVASLRIENPDGKGITVRAGAPLLRDLQLDVSDVALAFDGASRARVQGCVVARAAHGVYVGGDAAPEVEGLRIHASGGGMVFRQQAAGSFSDVQITSGSFAAVETHEDSAPELERLLVVAAGTGGLFLHGRSKPVIRGLRLQHSGLAGVEVAEQAAPRLEDLSLEGCGGSGFFLRDRCTPRIVDAVVRRPRMAGVEASGDADPVVDGLRVESPLGSGLFLHGAARGTWMEVRVDQATLAAVEVAEQAHPELERLRLWGGAREGLRVVDRAAVEAVGLEVQLCLRAAVEASGAARLEIEDLRVEDCRDAGLHLSGGAALRLRRARFAGTDRAAVVVLERARLHWREGGATADPALVAGGEAVVELHGVELVGELRASEGAQVLREA